MSKAGFSILFGKILDSVAVYRGRFLTALLVLAAGSAVNLSFPAIIRAFLNSQGYLKLHTFEAVAILLALFAFQACCFYWRSYLFSIVAYDVVNDLRKSLFRSIINRPVSFFQKYSASELSNRLVADPVLVQDLVSMRLSVLLRYGLQVIFAILLMFMISVRLSLAILVLLPVLVFISKMLSKNLKAASRNLQDEISKAGSQAQEFFSAIKTIKAFCAEGLAINKFSELSEHAQKSGYRRANISAYFQSTVSFLLNAAIVLVLVYGVKLVADNKLTTGDLTGFMLYGALVGVSFALFIGAITESIAALAAAERVFELIDSDVKDSNLIRIDEIKDINFVNLSFNYPEKTTLQNINLTFAKGSKNLVVGPSGSGKSTLAELLLGFHDFSGQLLISANNINSINSNDYRSKLAYVPQEAFLFSGSIRENLTLGIDYSDADLIDVIRKVNLKDWFESLADGLITPIGVGGGTLSAGQRQRLAIARALLRKPDLLILDEATSALDSENERIIDKLILDLDSTVVMISHRLSQAEMFDQVLLIDGGMLTASGKHLDLLDSSERYRSMIESGLAPENSNNLH